MPQPKLFLAGNDFKMPVQGEFCFVTSRLGTGKTIAIFCSVSSPVAVVLGGLDPRLADTHQVGRIVTAPAAAPRPRGRQGWAAAAAPPAGPPTTRHQGEGGAPAPLLLCLTAGSVGMVAAAPLQQYYYLAKKKYRLRSKVTCYGFIGMLIQGLED
jgi:hypothetical protein